MMRNYEERDIWKVNGFLIALLIFGLEVGGALLASENLVGFVVIALGVFLSSGLKMIQPNEARVFTLFGRYAGSLREDGYFWVNPFVSGEKISLKVRNFESEKIKVNDASGNPILIGAVIVWKVKDPAKAVYDVDNYQTFVSGQSESAIRELASHYPYESYSGEISLRSDPEKVADELGMQLKDRLTLAGVEVIEARISHLAYAPEIAKVMLRRQQADAVIAARQKIVEGAMGMVEHVLEHMESKGVVRLDEERKAAMANNLLVALVSESEATPVINTGTLY